MLYTYYDVETSGLKVGCDVLSFSYMLADEDLDVKKAETFYFWKEGVTQWTEEAYNVNGLSKDFLRQYENQYEDNLKRMYLAMSYADLVGYNSGWYDSNGIIHGYDYPVIKNFLERNNLYAPSPVSMTDVMKISEQRYKRRLKLTTVFEKNSLSEELAKAYSSIYFKEDGVAHNSSYDVIMTAMIFSKYYKEGLVGEQTQPGNSEGHLEERPIDEYKIVFKDDHKGSEHNNSSV